MATNQLMELVNGDLSVDLYTWVKSGTEAHGFEALSGIEGFGMTDQRNRWFEGAGHGAVYRGSRVLSRLISMPLWARAEDRQALNELLSKLSFMLNPDRAPARLRFGMPDQTIWYVDVVRDGGGDYVRRSKDTDNRTWFRTTLELKSGDAYWTRENPEQFLVVEDTSGRGLLPNLAELQLSFSGAFGNFTVNNPGDARAQPYWTFNGPFTRILMVGPQGETLEWNGVAATNEKIYLDVEHGTMIDASGASRYGGLSSNPQFWDLDSGISNVTVIMEDTSSASYALCQWYPRKWAVI